MSVTGQLIPVQIAYHKSGGVEELETVGSVALVGFDEQNVCAHFTAEGGVGQHHGGDAFDLIGTLLVIYHGFSGGTEDGCNHLHGGGFAVGAGDGNDMLGQLYPAQDIRADFQGVFSGQAAAFAHHFTHKTQKLAGQNGEKLSHSYSSSEDSVNSKKVRTTALKAAG